MSKPTVDLIGHLVSAEGEKCTVAEIGRLRVPVPLSVDLSDNFPVQASWLIDHLRNLWIQYRKETLHFQAECRDYAAKRLIVMEKSKFDLSHQKQQGSVLSEDRLKKLQVESRPPREKNETQERLDNSTHDELSVLYGEMKKLGYPSYCMESSVKKEMASLLHDEITPESIQPPTRTAPEKPPLLPPFTSYWICGDCIYGFTGLETTPEEEQRLRVQHFHLSTLKELDSLQLQVEAFENLSAIDLKRREAIPRAVRLFVWQRDGGQCVRCGGKEKLEFDHIIPVAEGGGNTERNIELLCERCNREKGRRI